MGGKGDFFICAGRSLKTQKLHLALGREGEGGRAERLRGAACSEAPSPGYCMQLKKATAGLPCPHPPPRFIPKALYTE